MSNEHSPKKKAASHPGKAAFAIYENYGDWLTSCVATLHSGKENQQVESLVVAAFAPCD